MEWYCALADNLLNPWGTESNGRPIEAILDTLRTRVVSLYRKLLLFLMQSICSYYRHQGVVFAKNITDLHSKWASSLKQIKEEEAALRIDSDQVKSIDHRKTLQNIDDRSLETMKLVGNIDRTFREFWEEQRKIQTIENDRVLLKQLFVVDPKDDMDAIEMRKDNLLDDAFKWILDVPEFKAFTNDLDVYNDNQASSDPCRLLWIKGPAGTGKTMLLLGIIRELSERSAALSPGIVHFFFQNANNSLNSSMAALRSLIWMLVHEQPHLLRHLREKYENAEPSFVGKPAFIGLSKVLENMLRDPDLEPVYFIVDALDECDDGLPEFIKLIAHSITITDKVNWLVSSRPSVPLGNCIAANSLVELDSQRLEAPVHAYINHQLAQLQDADGYTDAIINDISYEVTSRAKNTYLWVWFVFQQLNKPRAKGKLLNGMYALRTVRTFPPGLSALYNHIMESIEQGDEDDPAYCKAALRAVYHAYRLLSLSELATFVNLPEDQVVRIVGECGSFLTLTSTTVSLIHQSANDYLRENYLAHLGSAGIAQGHAEMGRLCLGAMSAGLHKNMYSLTNMGPYARTTPPPSPDPLAAVRYACVYWVDHICDAAGHRTGKEGASLLNKNSTYAFLLEHFLHWLEALSLLDKIPAGLASIQALRDLLPADDTSQFAAFVRDMFSFVMWNSYCIELSPLQAYASALLFSPKNSKVRRHFEDQHELDWIITKPAVQDDWEPYVQLNGHQIAVKAAQFSPDESQLVSGGVDHTVKVWDVSSGMCTCTFLGHTSNVTSVAFSTPDGRYVASGADDHIIRVWDVASGECIQTVPYSPVPSGLLPTSLALCTFASTQLASGFNDGTVRVWDVASKKLVKEFGANEKSVTSLAFAPDGKRLTSTSTNNLEQVWDAVSGTCIETNEREPFINNLASYSVPGHNKLVARWEDDIIRVWDTSLVHHAQIAKNAKNNISALVYSPDGTQVAAGSEDGTVTVWDAVTGVCISDLKEHTSLVSSVAFFPNGQQLASSSYDGTVKLWTVSSSECLHTLKYHQKSVFAIAVISNGQFLVTLSNDGDVKVWSVPSWECIQTLSNVAMDLVISPDEKKLLCVSENCGMGVFDIISGQRMLGVNDRTALSLARTFSPDGSKLAFQSEDESIEVWDLLTHERTQALFGNDCIINSIVFSPDGASLATLTIRGALKVWDVASAACIREIDEFDGASIATVFSPTGKGDVEDLGQLHGLSWNGTWVTKDGKYLFWLPYQYRSGLMYSVYGDSIAIGVSPGKVWVLGL